jgi:erythromycin esterase-like protein
VKILSVAVLGSILAVPAWAQQQGGRSAEREQAIERCNANRGTDCESDAGLAEWLATPVQPTPGSVPAAQAARQRERAIARCNANRGSDCETDAGLAEWLLQERSRDEAEGEGSRSIHQTAPRPAPR